MEKSEFTSFVAWILWDASGIYPASLHVRREDANKEKRKKQHFVEARWRISRVLIIDIDSAKSRAAWAAAARRVRT